MNPDADTTGIPSIEHLSIDRRHTTENCGCCNVVSNQIHLNLPCCLFETFVPLRRPLCVERPVNGQLYNAAHEIGGPVQVLPGGSKVMHLTYENECLLRGAERLACTAV